MGRPKKDAPNRADGLYEVKVTIGKAFDGKLIRKSFYSTVSKADAKAKGEQYKINQAVRDITGEAPEAPVTAFSTWATKWLETYKEGTVKEHTYLFTYKCSVENFLIPFFGKANLNDIKQIDVQRYFNTVRNTNGKPLSKRTLDKHKMILSAIFDVAIENELCFRNPVKRINYPKVSDKKEKHVWTKEQAEIAEKYCMDHWRLDIVAYLNLGIRRSELLGMKWTDIDFQNKTVHIQRALTPSKGKVVIDKPKSKNSERIIPFSADFARYLKSFVNDNEFVIGTNGYMHPSGYTNNFNRYMKKLSEATGVPILTPHELRHTYGTLKREEGVDIYTIQRLMGHSDISVTASIYVHNDIEVLRKAAHLSDEVPKEGDPFEVTITIGEEADGSLKQKTFYSDKSLEDAREKAEKFKAENAI